MCIRDRLSIKHSLFLDCCKAFDKVPRLIRWRVLENRGIPLHLIQVIKSMYLFNPFLDGIVRVWLNSVNGRIRVVGKILKTLVFADNQILLATYEDDLQRMLYSLNNM